MSENRVR